MSPPTEVPIEPETEGGTPKVPDEPDEVEAAPALPEVPTAVMEEEESVSDPPEKSGGEKASQANFRELTAADMERLEARLGADNLETLRKKLRGEWRHVQARDSRLEY